MMRVSLRRRLVAMAVAVIASTAALVGVPALTTSTPARAFTGSDFNPGYIVSDYQFYSRDAMTEAEIQAFLDAKIGGCTNGLCLNVLKVDTSNRPADNMCSVGYTGAPAEPVSRIIYKVQYSCGISAKALLVTLQKEQGLVTKKAPTDGALRAAMGYGCPDTAACDSTYYGIFNQLYQAARQLKRYGLGAPDNISFRYFPVGGVSSVRLSPNAACGSTSVYIQNKATAALYYYTPYQPNAAALANLGGTGDGCSSYGNRNFWWYFYNWFGNPLAGAGDEQIDSAYEAAGGATGPLGALVAPHQCGVSLTCVVDYANGSLYWRISRGTYSVVGDVYRAYVVAGASSGQLGWPASAEVADASNGGGTAQMFDGGSIYKSVAGSWAVAGSFRDAYWARNGSSGVLGWPTSAAAGVPQNGGGTAQNFQAGVIATSSAGMYAVLPPVAATYLAAGGAAGTLGFPTSSTVASASNGGGSAQVFQNGSIYSSSPGAFIVSGPIRDAYWATNGSDGRYGWPTGAQTCTTGGCTQVFQNGTITSALGVSSAIDAAYSASGGAAGPLGAPVSGVVSSSDNGGGVAREYRRGSIYSSSNGTYVVTGAVVTAYWARGGSSGALGWPTGPASCGLTLSGCVQSFQNGVIYASPQFPGRATSGAVATAYAAVGGPDGILGWPASDVVPTTDNGGGSAQEYQRGSIYSSGAGTFVVAGTVVRKYWSLGGSGGALGWPSADLVKVAGNGGGTAQAFQNGYIYSSSAGTFAVQGAIRTAYAAQNASAGVLGWPVTDEVRSTSNGGGSAQMFQNASIYSSAAGAFAVTGPIRDKYWAGRGSDGALGWPTAEQVCLTGGSPCSQTFQNGTVTTSTASTVIDAAYLAAGGPSGRLGPVAGGVTVSAANGGGVWQQYTNGSIYSTRSGTFVVGTPIATVYWAAGGSDGSLGWPVSVETPSSANGGGTAQMFQNASIYSSPSGTFAVSGALRTAYWATNGSDGTYGWPTAAAVCNAGGTACTQTFQNGTVSVP